MSEYCDLEDLFSIGLPRENVVDNEVAATAVKKAIQDASADMDAYLGNRYKLPLIAPFDRSLRSKCAFITAYYLAGGTGVNPAGDGDSLLIKRYDDAITWLREVVAHRVSPQITDSSPAALPGESSIGAPRVRSGSGRGYSSRQTPRGRGYFQGD